mmetsp:Transcript_33292/g.75880  ORF Transcript_33292/g.75880 Transcript_33292/m.75880 type:complete len:81 (+) Transcript_33292:157-399(+)
MTQIQKMTMMLLSMSDLVPLAASEPFDVQGAALRRRPLTDSGAPVAEECAKTTVEQLVKFSEVLNMRVNHKAHGLDLSHR